MQTRWKQPTTPKTSMITITVSALMLKLSKLMKVQSMQTRQLSKWILQISLRTKRISQKTQMTSLLFSHKLTFASMTTIPRLVNTAVNGSAPQLKGWKCGANLLMRVKLTSCGQTINFLQLWHLMLSCSLCSLKLWVNLLQSLWPYQTENSLLYLRRNLPVIINILMMRLLISLYSNQSDQLMDIVLQTMPSKLLHSMIALDR